MSGSDESRNGRYEAGDPGELPPELQSLVHALDRDGAGWRTHLPDEQQLARRVIGLIERPRPQSSAVTGEREAPHESSAPSPLGAYRFSTEPRRGRGLLPVAAMLAVVILIAALLHEFVSLGMATATRPTPPPTPAATQTPRPATHQLALRGYQTAEAMPNAHGLALYAIPAGASPPQDGVPAVSFYDFRTKAITTLDTAQPAPDGTPRGIQQVAAAGDWVVYEVADRHYTHWGLWAANVVTQEKRLVDSYLTERSGPSDEWIFNSATDGTDLVWSWLQYVPSGSSGASTSLVRDYSLATGTTRALLDGPDTRFVKVLALSGGTLLFSEQHNRPAATDGTYLWPLRDSQPQRLAADLPAAGSVNATYAVWDDPQAGTSALYDRRAGALQETWQSACIRPVLAPESPSAAYAACVDPDGKTVVTVVLAPLPVGTTTTLGGTSKTSGVTMANGRAYWVEPNGAGNGAFGTAIDYVDLPTS